MSTSFAPHHAGHVSLDWRQAFNRLAAVLAPREAAAGAPDLPAELRRLSPHLLADIGVDPRVVAKADFSQRGTSPGI